MDSSDQSPWQPKVNNYPQADQQSHPVPEARPASGSGNKSLRIGLVFTLIFTVFLLLTIALAASVAYASVDIPLLSDKTEKQIKLFVFAMPFTPKTPEQILIVAAEQNKVFTTYNPDISFSGNFDSANVMLGSLDLKISGPVDITNTESPKFDIQAGAGLNYGGMLYSVSGKARKIDETFYGKIDSISDSILDTYESFFATAVPEAEAPDMEFIKQQLAPIFASWIRYDLSGLDSEAREMLKQQEKEQLSAIEKAQDSIEKLLSDDVILPEVVRLNDESVDGVDTYHLQVKPSKQALNHLLALGIEESGKPIDDEMKETLETMVASVDQFTVDAWFGKDDLIVRKAAVTSSISLARLLETSYAEENEDRLYGTPFSQATDLVDPRINTSAVLVLRDVGMPVTVTVPSPVVDPAQYSTMLQEVLYGEEMRNNINGNDIMYEEDTGEMQLGIFDYIGNTE